VEAYGSAENRATGRWALRASVVGLLVVLCLLAGFSILAQTRIAERSKGADQATRVSETYQDARFWVGQEESLERKYRLEPEPAVLALHEHAEQSVLRDLRALQRLDRSPATDAVVARIERLHARYARASDGMFRAVDAHDAALVIKFDHTIVDPVFGAMEKIVFANASVASRRALAESASLREEETQTTKAIVIAFTLSLGLLAAFALTITRFRRRLDAAGRSEVRRLSEIAITDPLTGLRNHRAFHEDLARGLHRVGRTGVPMSLVILDVDRLKDVNDTFGHQAGDDRLRAVADAMSATGRGGDGAYRIGGDEFAVILDGVRAWNALEFVQRLRAALASATPSGSGSVSAGIAEALTFTTKDRIVREADLALITTKRDGQVVGIYSTDMERNATALESDADEYRHRTLASALALAVDAKDTYTRSHSQTVSELCVLIAGELGFDDERLARIRIAGLLHDVGKIGVPDAILNKPSQLTADEYDQIKAHASLGCDIVTAADLPTEAQWVRQHHERYDGNGYPDQIGGEDIALEARIIGVADAYEAMTSDRPYRNAPGQDYAIGELRRHAGTQFDAGVAEALCAKLEDPAGAPAELLVPPAPNGS
jgi:diguanylate cyclase (GGDEF)-like protein/putative nucleotidyltransferase with HDIG domain